MKILEINKYYYDRRGAEGYMLSVMDELSKRGHEVAIFSMHHPRNLMTPWSSYFVDYLNTDQLRLSSVPRYFGRALWSKQAYSGVRDLIDDFRPDVAHVHNIYTQLSPSVLQGCASKGVPVVLTVHDYGLVSGNYALWSGVRSLYPDHMGFFEIANSRYIKGSFLATLMLEKISRIHRMCRMHDRYIDRYIAVSHAVKEVLVWSGIKEEKIEVLHNFVEVDGLERSAEPRGFFYYGALESNKGIKTLIEAARTVDEPLYIAGAGPLEECVRREGGDRVEYLGQLSKHALSARLATVRAAIFPSLSREAYSTACLEAMMTGTPVIVSDAGGFPEMVHGGEFGIMAEAGDVAQLATAMHFVVNHQSLAEERAKQAKKWIEEHEGKEKHINRLISLFEEVAVDNSKK